MRMSLNRGEMTKDKAQIVAEKFSHLLNDRIGMSAVNALEVPILEKSNGCGFLSRSMVMFGCRIPEFDDFRSTHNHLTCLLKYSTAVTSDTRATDADAV